MEPTLQKMPSYKDGGYPKHTIVTSQRQISEDFIQSVSKKVYPNKN